MPSGNDLRKNNARAIQGFEEFRSQQDNEEVWLVITSFFDDHTKRTLERLSGHVVFTGNVSEAELKWLYENAEALLFATEYEGLGLPVLEAAEVNMPVVCSSLSVFDEISPTAFYYFDERNPSSIAEALRQCYAKQDLESRLSEYPAILKKYSWQRTAKTALGAMESIKVVMLPNKPRLAVFAPNPTGYSAIGKVVMLTHDALSSIFDVDYYLEEGRTQKEFSRPSFLPALASCYPATDFTARSYTKYDAVLYHVGNSEYHVETIKRALYMPGHMIIHDTKLGGVFEEELLRFGHMVESRVAAERQLNNQNKTTRTSYLTSLVNNQLSVITHSKYAKTVLDTINVRNVQILTANLPIGVPKNSRRKRNNIFKVGFGGIIHQSKGLSLVDDILESKELDDVEVHIFGVPIVEQTVLDRLMAHPNVIIEQNLSDFEFESKLADMDVVISYRPNYNGETSLTVIEAMRYGVVPIVRKVGWFDELPDECAQKVNSEDEVIVAISTLKNDPALLHKKSLASKQLIQGQYTYKKYAQLLLEAIENSKNEGPNRNYNIAKALKDNAPKQAILKLLEDTREV
jgi:glycosyltransferase involved in cell wall biosynthesis